MWHVRDGGLQKLGGRLSEQSLGLGGEGGSCDPLNDDELSVTE